MLGLDGFQSTVAVVVPAGEWCWMPPTQRRALSPSIAIEEDAERFRLTIPNVDGVNWIKIGSVQSQQIQPGTSELVHADPGKLVAKLSAEAVRERDGMLLADALLADELDKVGFADAYTFRESLSEALSEFKEGKRDAAKLWSVWLPFTDDQSNTTDLARNLLAGALWPEVKKRRVEHLPALVRVVATDMLLPAMSRQLPIPALDDGVVRNGKGQQIGAFDVAVVDSELIRTGLFSLGSLAGHRTINTVVHKVHQQHEEGVADWRTVEFEGGWSGLKAEIGMANADTGELQSILYAGQHVHWQSKNRDEACGGLWTWGVARGSRARRGWVRIVAGDILSPGLASAMRGTSKAARDARKLLPELRHEPPLDAIRRNEQGAAYTLARVFIGRLVDHAEEVYLRGGVRLTEQDWIDMARAAGFPATLIGKLRDSWLEGNTTSPALIERVEKDRWALAENHAPELEFIKAGGKKSANGRARGKKGARGRGGDKKHRKD